jgi:hypothetical protein
LSLGGAKWRSNNRSDGKANREAFWVTGFFVIRNPRPRTSAKKSVEQLKQRGHLTIVLRQKNLDFLFPSLYYFRCDFAGLFLHLDQHSCRFGMGQSLTTRPVDS